ncbi:hypothetical protein ACHFCA_12600 [Delftia tsuruhatensis]
MPALRADGTDHVIGSNGAGPYQSPTDLAHGLPPCIDDFYWNVLIDYWNVPKDQAQSRRPRENTEP